MNGNAEGRASFLPTRDILASWKNERDRLHAEISRLQSECEAFDAMISAAERLLPQAEEIGLSEVPIDTKRGRSIIAHINPAERTWTATVKAIVYGAGRVSYEELREAIGKTHLAKKLAKTDKSFYGAIGKLANAEEIFRHNGWLFSPEALEKLKRGVAAGVAVDEEAPRNNPAHHSPFGEAIKAFMDGRPDGASSSEIISELKKTPEFADTIERHKTHPYNVLSRLVDQGELVKGGGRYFRAPNKGGQA